MSSLPRWQQLLADRGILDEALSAGWTVDGEGWRYPILRLDGVPHRSGDGLPVHRWKAFDSAAKPKYRWIPSGLGKLSPKYYTPEGLKEAIAEANGVVLLASGEPDTLTWRTAGARNALSLFGEGNIPEALAMHLSSLGVTAVEAYPDLDNAGLLSAAKLRDVLRKGLIDYRPWRLPGETGSKMDINKLWQAHYFNADTFYAEIATLPALHLPEATQPTLAQELGDDLPAGFYAAVETALKARGLKKYGEDGWSNNFPCVFVSHEHDERQPGAQWNKTLRIFKCHKCNGRTWLAIPTGEQLGLDWKAFRETRTTQTRPQTPQTARTAQTPQTVTDTSADTARTETQTAQPSVQTPAPEPRKGKSKGVAISSEAAANRLGMFDRNLPPPLPMMFTEVAKIGGFMRLLPPRKLLAIAAYSGGFKTTFAECLTDKWNRRGYDGMYWGDEWSALEYAWRRAQRICGITFEQQLSAQAWESEEMRGTVKEDRVGTPFTDEQVGLLAKAKECLLGWRGRIDYIEPDEPGIEGILGVMERTFEERLAEGRRPSFAVIDYIQLTATDTTGKYEQIERAALLFKRFCIARDLVGVVGSQVLKSESRIAQTTGKGMEQDAMQYISPFIFNSILMLTREVDSEGNYTNVLTARAAKNSIGQSRYDAHLGINTEYMRLEDGIIPPRA